MVKLKNILHGVDTLKVKGNIGVGVKNIQFDSRELNKGDMFFAIKGTITDGHDYINSAVKNGASVVVCETLPEPIHDRVTFILVKNSALALGIVASNYFGNPSEKLKLIGVTGTNGKTTTVHLLYNIFRKYGKKAGLISTTGNLIEGKKLETKLTTPDSIRINSLLSEMADTGCEYAFMEVSSHAIDQYRTSGLVFNGGIFTNVTHDHLDYHGNFRNYINAKKKFFDDLGENTFALVNADDKNSGVMIQNCKARVSTYALRSVADYKGKIIENLPEGTLLNFDNNELWSRLVGEFNVYNLLAAYVASDILGVERDELIRLLSDSDPVPGRLEIIRSENGITAIVDYAHTPDALDNILSALIKVKKGKHQLITVVGAGGDRDKAKRPKMAAIAVNKSDKVIFTSDNPRTEDPLKIIEDMLEGVEKNDKKRILVLVDRTEAIKTACMLSGKDDMILIAGKGHETYQEIRGVRNHFDDREVVAGIFKDLSI